MLVLDRAIIIEHQLFRVKNITKEPCFVVIIELIYIMMYRLDEDVVSTDVAVKFALVDVTYLMT